MLWNSYSRILANLVLMNMKMNTMILTVYLLLLLPKLLRNRDLKRIKAIIASTMPKYIINKTIKPVIVWDARHCAEPSTYMTSFIFPKEPLMSSPLYRSYLCSGMLNNLTKVTNLASGINRLLISNVIFLRWKSWGNGKSRQFKWGRR